MGIYCSVNDLESILLKMACRDTDREIVMIYMCMMCVSVYMCFYGSVSSIYKKQFNQLKKQEAS